MVFMFSIFVLNKYRSQRMSQSLKSSKSEDGIHKILAQTIQKYSTPAHILPKPMPSVCSKAKVFPSTPEIMNDSFLGKYENLMKNLKEYKQITNDYMKTQATKNHTFYLGLLDIVDKNRIKSQNWICNRIKKVNKILDTQLLNIQQKIYQLAHHLTNLQKDKEQIEFEKIKSFHLPIFTFKSIDVRAFQTLIHNYTSITQQCQLFSNIKQNLHKNNLADTHHSKYKEPPTNQNTFDEYLRCDEEMNWSERMDDHPKHYINPSDVILEQSESQESSLISTIDFV